MTISALAPVLVAALLGSSLEDQRPHPHPHPHPKHAGFGPDFKRHFLLAPGFRNFNHGSFGATPRAVIEAQRKLVEQMEAYPDAWFRNDADCAEASSATQCYHRRLEPVREKIAAMMKAHTKDMVFVDNASAGVNAVLRSLGLGSGDRVLILSTAYPVTTNTLAYLRHSDGVEFVSASISFPVTGPEGFLAPVADLIQEAEKMGKPFKLAVFSHISSVPAVILPVEELSTMCKAAGMAVLIDGAHALGQIAVDVTALERAGADYYVANGHKWLYSPKGSAVLWVKPAEQHRIVPTVISSEFNPEKENRFIDEFVYLGTRDYTPYVSMLDAIKWREEHGGDAAIEGYLQDLAHWSQEYLTTRWGTEAIAPLNMTSALFNVELPAAAQAPGAAGRLQQALMDDHDAYVVVYENGGRQWTRLSAQLYLGRSDFIWLADTVDELLSSGRLQQQGEKQMQGQEGRAPRPAAMAYH